MKHKATILALLLLLSASCTKERGSSPDQFEQMDTRPGWGLDSNNFFDKNPPSQKFVPVYNITINPTL